MKFRIADLDDIAGVSALQDLYLYANLSEEERREGFVTTPFTQGQLEEIIGLEGLFVAEDLGQIFGYAFAGSWDYFRQWEIFPYMCSRFPAIRFLDWEISTENSFQYGPVCLHRNYRAQGWFNHLFEAMRIHWRNKYPLGITFINRVNERSTCAHVDKLGWTVVDEFEFQGKSYLGLAFEMKNSVLGRK